MQMIDVIEKKASKGELTHEEIVFAVNGFVKGEVEPYQMAALLMAIRLNGMTHKENADLTMTMMHSGDVVDLSDLPGVKVDKHSSGGVGDTTTLVVAPLVAACGGTVAKMSGRGLAFSGGTLDKLEAIPGVCIEQPISRFKEIVKKTGVAVIGQSGNLVPADKKMYALRDVTGTVQSVPLIAASIMSKKLAAGADAIVLDVKVGSGAFVKNLEDAKTLAEAMVAMGKVLNRQVVACITDMNQPLGMAVGNALEVREAVELLSGQIPQGDPLYEICMLLGAQMLRLSGLAKDDDEGRSKLQHALTSGTGLEKLRQMVTALGGDSSYLSMERINELCKVKQQIPLYPKKEGYITCIHAECIGRAAQLLGAGRAVITDKIDPAVGLVMQSRLGDRVDPATPLCILYANDDKKVDEVKTLMEQAVEIGDAPATIPPLCYDVIR